MHTNIVRTTLAGVALTAATFARQTGISVEEAKLLGADTAAGDALGTCVALEGDTAILGAPKAGPNERGAVYVFQRIGGGWTQQAKLVATLGTNADFDHFGASAAIDGDVLVVGAPDWGNEDGHVHVFRRNGASWNAEAVLGPPTTGYYYAFGGAVAIEGTMLAASAPKFGPTSEGAVAIYEYSGGAWTFSTWVQNPYPNSIDFMGEQLALTTVNGGRLLFALTRTHGALGMVTWTGSWKFHFGFGGGTSPISAVAASGTTLLVSEANQTVNGQVGAGRASAWTAPPGPNLGATLQSSLFATDPGAGDHFGTALAIDGDTIVIGAPNDSDPAAIDRGAAYVFDRVGTVWQARAKLIASDAAAGDLFGSHLAASPVGVLVGVPFDSNSAGTDAGSVYVFRFGLAIVTYCTAGVSSGGCVATLSSTGRPSASLATAFALHASNLDGQRTGLFFYGVSGALVSPWSGSSFLCIKPPVQRTSSQVSGGTAGACDGALSLDWNSFASSTPGALGQPFTTGLELWAQAWYRDPTSTKTSQLSDALGFELQP